MNTKKNSKKGPKTHNVLSFSEYDKLPGVRKATPRTEVGGDILREGTQSLGQDILDDDYSEAHGPVVIRPEDKVKIDYIQSHADSLTFDQLLKVTAPMGKPGFGKEEREPFVDFLFHGIAEADSRTVSEVYSQVKKYIDGIITDAEKRAQNESIYTKNLRWRSVRESAGRPSMESAIDAFSQEWVGRQGIVGVWSEGDRLKVAVDDIEKVEGLPGEYRGIPIEYEETGEFTTH